MPEAGVVLAMEGPPSFQNILDTSAEQPKAQPMLVFSTSCSNVTTMADTVRVEIIKRAETTQQSTLAMHNAQRNAG